MQKLYLDCDGVILDTINKSYKMMREEGITTEEEIADFYSNISWEKLIIESGEIKGSINKIKELMEHYDVEILTHVYSEKETKAKSEYFKRVLPNINMIAVPKHKNKADVVNAKGAILVDDYLENLEYWESEDGIPIKFSDSRKECKYTVIEDLLELLNINTKNKIKVKE